MKVAVGVIFDRQHRILVAKRPLHKPYGGYWEFPGGKLESNEDGMQALYREIKEEVGIQILSAVYWGDIGHEPTETTQLMIFAVYDFLGEPQSLENQPEMQWVSISQLNDLMFPPANQAIIKLIRTTHLA